MRYSIRSMGKAFASLFLVGWLLLSGAGQACAADVLNRGEAAASDLFERGQQLSEGILEKGGKAVDKAREEGTAGLDLLKKNADALTGKLQGVFEKSPSGSGPVYSRLIVRNRCYGNVWANIEKFKKYWGYMPNFIEARSTAYLALWPGTETPRYSYSMTRNGAPELRKTLESMAEESEQSTASLRSILFHEYTYTFCKDEADLGTPDAEFARAAKPGEQIDVFHTYLTQVPGSTERTFAYTDYPITFFLDDYPLCRTRSDDDGYVRISLPRGTRGRLRISGPAFQGEKGFMLYEEWAPVQSFTAKGGEIVYHIPPHKNTAGW